MHLLLDFVQVLFDKVDLVADLQLDIGQLEVEEIDDLNFLFCNK